MNREEILEVKALLAAPKKIVITTHRNPDGDAYGSSLALYAFLLKLGHQVEVVSPNDCPDFLKWLPGVDEIVIYENDLERADIILDRAELVFALDYNAFHRLGEVMEPKMDDISPVFILIDHHQQPDDFARYAYVNPEKGSTSEMIYEFIEQLHGAEHIDYDIATCLYTGILTDTGSFRFPATSSQTHRIVAELLDKGVKNAEVYNKIHDVNTFDRIQLLGRALDNMVVLESFNTAYITLSQKELNEHNFQRGDTEGFVNYALSVKNVIFAAIFIEDKKQRIIKISFRSVGDFSVNEFARKHFDGGGHINAAGGRSSLSLKLTVDRFKSLLADYKESLSV